MSGRVQFAVQGLSGQTYNPAPGYSALGVQQLQQMDPTHAGPDAAAMAYFKTLPAPNSNITGDGLNYQGFVFASPTHETQNVYIARSDYNITQDGKQRLSVMGATRDDSSDACGGCQPYSPVSLRKDRLSTITKASS